MIYEYCNGGDLNKYLKNYISKNNRPIGEKEVQKILKDILNGLSCLHRNNVVHHDIKPANILLKYDNEKDLNDLNFLKCKFKISDFGLSKYKNEQQERMIGGSPLYMEPSLFDRDVLLSVIENEKVDIWALGIMTYELLFVKTPFENTSYVPENAMQELVSNLNKGIYFINLEKCNKLSLQIIAFINSCLQFEQSKRCSSEELQLSEFITREIPYFEFVSQNNLSKIPSQYIIGNMIKLNIRDERKLNQYLDLL
jgi:serine/threonine protein kinase